MVFTPYVTLSVVSVLIYRGMKKNEAFRRAREPAPESPSGPGPDLADPAS